MKSVTFPRFGYILILKFSIINNKETSLLKVFNKNFVSNENSPINFEIANMDYRISYTCSDDRSRFEACKSKIPRHFLTTDTIY